MEAQELLGLELCLEDLVVVSPDVGGIKMTHAFAKALKAPMAIVAKNRVSAEEVEAMVKSEVARVLEEMHFQIQDRINHEMKQFTEEFIPNLAEKIIKDEIHRLLSNPPV
jgi:hypothetical protein